MSSASSAFYYTMIWEHLQRVQQELKQGSRETQDTAIAALHDTLDANSSFLFPSFIYPLLTGVLHFYCQKVLPYMGIPAEDQRIVCEEFEDTITHLNTQEQTAKHLEAQLKQFFLKVKFGTLDTIEDIVTALYETISSRPEKDKRLFQQIRVNPRHPRHPRSILSSDRSLEKSYRTFKKSPFTTSHVIPFFETTIAQLPPEIKELFGYMRSLFWFQLYEFVHIKAVLVNTKTKEALITRLDVTTSLESKGLDTLDVENFVDDRMEHSCWNAVQAARTFLEDQFPDILKNKVLQVKCRFPNPTAVYNDTSASLLVCLKVIGDVLDMEIDPHTLVSGEVDGSGKVLPITCVAEKVLAAQHHPDIQRLFLPAEGLFMTSHRVEIIGVHDLSEAMAHYYGEAFRKKLRQFSRRQMLKSVAVAIATIPLGVLTFRNILTHPVTEQDVWLLEYAEELYQKHSDHKKAIRIFQSLLEQFGNDNFSEVLQFRAQTFEHLGNIYRQQYQVNHSIYAYQKAFDCWKSIHNREYQAHMLLRIGVVYLDTSRIGDLKRNNRIALQYYNQVKPYTDRFTTVQDRYYGALGTFYYAVGEHELAKKHLEQRLACFDSAEKDWWYYTCKEYLGGILIKLGEYDEAFEIFESNAQASAFRNPYDQTRNFRNFSNLFLSMGNQEEGLQYAEKALTLAKEFGLTRQEQAIQTILAKYHVHPNFSIDTNTL